MTKDQRAEGLTRRRMLALSGAAAGTAAFGGTGAVAASGHERYDETITSHDGTELAATVYRPAGATADDPVPMILHSHGWGRSRISSPGAFWTELKRGFGVLSFDQRGHGETGGESHVGDPDVEGRDVLEVLDYVENLAWVRRTYSEENQAPTGRADDPMVFAIGGSYGGAYQLLGALTETREEGYTRFDALAPEITWYDLSESLAPEEVPRTTWITLLYATGVEKVPDYVHRSFVYSISTGDWPDGELPGEPDVESEFFEHGPSGFVADGIQLDVPVLFGQGLSDNLFNLNQAWKNFEQALTEDARRKSAVIGYNGGHDHPSVLPNGTTDNSNDACSPRRSFDRTALGFFERIRDGTGDARDEVGSPYSLTTADGSRCVQLDALEDRTTLASGVDLTVSNDGAGNLDVTTVDGDHADAVTAVDGFPGDYDPSTVQGVFADADVEGGVAATPTGAGAPIQLELGTGELTVAGVPELSAAVTTVGVKQRLFFALSVGQSPDSARIVQNNVMPLREPEPLQGVDRTVELPGVAVDVAAGETLYLTLSPVSDMSFGHGSTRTPGVVVLEDLTVDVPLVDS